MNPYQLLPIYSPDVVKKYIGQRLGLQPPHIFATADDAYRLMRDSNKNQSVIIRCAPSWRRALLPSYPD